MTPSNKAREQRLKNAMLQSQAAFEPHLDKMETEKGLMAMMVISYVSMSLHAGTASPAELVNAIKSAAAMSGIPEEALEAYPLTMRSKGRCAIKPRAFAINQKVPGSIYLSTKNFFCLKRGLLP